MTAPAPKRGPRPLNASRRIRYVFETLAAYILYGFFRILPLDAASATGGWILLHLGPRMGASRTALRNLELAFPEKTETERTEIMRGMWDNLGRVIAEYPHLRQIARERVEIVGAENFDLLRGERGGIFFGGHIANWEIGALAGRARGLKINVVYRKPNNPWVDSLLRHARGGENMGHITKSDKGAREMFTRLRAGETLGILMDQKLSEGVLVPFFGRPALTATAAAQFMLKFGCPLVPSVVERLDGARFRIHLLPPLEIDPTGDRDADILLVLNQVNAVLETRIRARPAQWLWLHKRWADADK